MIYWSRHETLCSKGTGKEIKLDGQRKWKFERRFLAVGRTFKDMFWLVASWTLDSCGVLAGETFISPSMVYHRCSVQFVSVQFSLLADLVVGGIWGTIQQRSSSSHFCRRPLCAVLAWAAMSTLWCCPSSISSANHGVAHPPRCPKGWFWRSCRGVWHARTMQISVSWQLPEEVPLDPQGRWSCPAPSRRSCLQVADTDKFHHVLGYESLDPLLFLFVCLFLEKGFERQEYFCAVHVNSRIVYFTLSSTH